MTPPTLPVLMPDVPGQRWSCHSCGDCCRALVGHVSTAERKRILDQNWTADLGADPLVRAGRSWVLNKRPDGACVFLDSQNRCKIHAKYGESDKPLACRIFPFSIRPTAQGWQTSLRFDCPSVTGSKGETIDRHRHGIAELTAELDIPRHSVIAPLQLRRKLIALPGEAEALMGHLRDWLEDISMPLNHRLVSAARLTTSLMNARLKSVRGRRFEELVEALVETLPDEGDANLKPPSNKHRGMLRQIAYAHAEHVTLTQLRAGVFGRARERWRQLREASAFLSGRGVVAAIPGLSCDVPFSAVETVCPATEQIASIEDLLRRYLTARLEGDSVFGPGYYGWPVIEGLSALWLCIAAAGWLARHEAASQQRTRIALNDVAKALGIIDRSATRLPALGTWAERTRLSYLSVDDALARLVKAYALVEDRDEFA